MSKAKVAVLKTNPKTVLEDYCRLMKLADYADYLSEEKDTAHKINISWHHFYPACSTMLWQLEGVFDKATFDELAENFLTDYRVTGRKTSAKAERSVRHLQEVFLWYADGRNRLPWNWENTSPVYCCNDTVLYGIKTNRIHSGMGARSGHSDFVEISRRQVALGGSLLRCS